MGGAAVKITTLSWASAVVALILSFSAPTDAAAGTKTSRVCAAKTVAELSVCRRGDQVSFSPTTLESVHIPALTAHFCDLTKTVVWNTRSFACVAGGERRVVNAADELKAKK